MIALVIALAAAPAASGAPGMWDFETDDCRGLILDGAARCATPELVIDGTASLLADTRGSRNRGWNEFLRTDSSAFPLRPDTAYTISFRYRVLAPTGDKVFYLLLRSPSLGHEAGDRGHTWWNAWDSDVHAQHTIIRTGDAPDYHLILGIRNEGAIAIDGLSVSAGPPPPEGTVVTHPTDLDASWADWCRARAETGTTAWMETVQLTIDPAGARLDNPEGEAYLRRLDVDVSEYLHSPLILSLGIPWTGMRTEYQELYVADAERDGVSWDELQARFRGDGMAIAIHGEPVMDPTWAAGGYYMCQASPRWHDYFLDRLKGYTREDNDGVNQDNIGVVCLFKGNLAFCEGCQRRFRERLRVQYDAATLARWEAADPDTFDLREFLLAHSLEGRAALDSPLVREYITSYSRTQLAAWIDVARHVHDWTRDRGRPYAIYGNQIGAMGPIPYAMLLGPWVDAVSMEHYWPAAEFYKPPRFHGAAWGYKLACAAAGSLKPVLIRTALEENGASLSVTATEFTLAEALASGGYRVFSPGANIPRYSGPHPVEVPAIHDLHLRYADWVRAHRGLFWGRQSRNRAAVVYSVPTHLFHHFPAIPGLDTLDEYKRFAAACILMDRLGLPYDVLVLPHPELLPDVGRRERMRGYDLVVFPGVVALGDDALAETQTLLDRGGRVLAFAPFAERDENYNPRAGGPPLRDHPRVALLPDLDQQLGNALWDRRDLPDLVGQVHASLETLYPPDERQIIGAVPEPVVLNVWEDTRGGFFALHVLNYDWDPAADRSRPVESLRFGLEVPERYRAYAPVVLTPETDDAFPVRTWQENGRTWIELPSVRLYAIVAWADADAVTRKTDYAQGMNLAMRVARLGGELPERWWDVLREHLDRQDGAALAGLREEWATEVQRRAK